MKDSYEMRLHKIRLKNECIMPSSLENCQLLIIFFTYFPHILLYDYNITHSLKRSEGACKFTIFHWDPKFFFRIPTIHGVKKLLNTEFSTPRLSSSCAAISYDLWPTLFGYVSITRAFI